MATNGDTVTIPACSQTNWTTTVNVNVGITLQGAGQGSTIIGDNVPKGTVAGSCNDGAPLIIWNVASPNSMRMTGMTINAVAADPAVCSRGHIKVTGTTHSMRVDHITISAVTSSIYISGDVWGVIDHYTFSGNFVTGVRVEHFNWNGFNLWTDNWGDASWSAAFTPGSNQGIFVEDSSFTGTATVASAAATDCYSGGHIIFRHNTVSTLDLGTHGADSDQRHRACRWLEAYSNTFTYTTINALGFIAWIRGGSGVFYNNTVTATGYSNNMVQVTNCRDASAGCGGGPNYTPWGTCDGTSNYDQNSSGGSGYRCVDQPGAGTSAQLGPDTGGGITPANTWVGNASDPIYIWNNTLNGSSYNVTNGTPHVQLNRDYFVGTARPAYTPYTYPHPLQGVAGSPTVTTVCPLASGTVGTSYNTAGSGILTASGGTPPYTWSISAGGLPAGLSVSGSSITGTPTTAGSSSFTLLATDNAAMTGTKACSMTVANPGGGSPVSAAGNGVRAGAFVP